jgi:uncharacterized protein
MLRKNQTCIFLYVYLTKVAIADHFQRQWCQIHLSRFTFAMVAQRFNLSSALSPETLRSTKWPLWLGTGLTLIASTGLVQPHGLTGWATLGIIGGGTLWYSYRTWRLLKADGDGTPVHLTPAVVKTACQNVEMLLSSLQQEWTEATPFVSDLQQQLAKITQGLTRQTLTLAIVGDTAVGKTTLKELLVQQQDWSQWDFSTIQEIALAELLETNDKLHPAIANSDVVLFVVQGDLSQTEWTGIEKLHNTQKRVLLLINKQDQYLPNQIELIHTQVQAKVKSLFSAETVWAIATCPPALKVRRHQADGSFVDTWEAQAPQVEPLYQCLQNTDAQVVSQLVLQQSFQQAQTLRETVQNQLNQVRRERAVPILERYQWIAAGTTFANPLPSLDMVATAVVTGKLVQELSTIYGVRFSLQNAQDVAEVVVKALIQMGGVEVATQLLSQILKANAATFVAGGLVQGVSAAYFTRIAGYTLIDCFEHQPLQSEGFKLDLSVATQAVQRVLQQHQRLDLLKDLLQQTKQRILPEGVAVA